MGAAIVNGLHGNPLDNLCTQLRVEHSILGIFSRLSSYQTSLFIFPDSLCQYYHRSAQCGVRCCLNSFCVLSRVVVPSPCRVRLPWRPVCAACVSPGVPRVACATWCAACRADALAQGRMRRSLTRVGGASRRRWRRTWRRSSTNSSRAPPSSATPTATSTSASRWRRSSYFPHAFPHMWCLIFCSPSEYGK